MRKITEIPEKRTRTRYVRDKNGNLLRFSEDYTSFKEVPTISGKERINHYISDGLTQMVFMLPIFLLFSVLIISLRPQNLLIIVLIFIGFFILLFAAISLYYIYFEYYRQQTPGQKSTDSIVVDEYGRKPNLKTIIKRTLLRFVPFEYISCLGNPSFGWHDKFSKTFVIKKEELEKLLKEIQE